MSCSSSCSNGNAGSFYKYEEIREKVKPADMIEIQRDGYKHWVICREVDGSNVWCYHVTNEINSKVSAKVSAQISVPFNTDAYIRYHMLEDILKDTKNRKPSLCRINNQEDAAKVLLAGQQPPPLSQVLEKLDELEKDSIVPYNMRSKNCEHYCTEWKYEIPWSTQISEAENKGLIVTLGSIVAGGVSFIVEKREAYIVLTSTGYTGLVLFFIVPYLPDLYKKIKEWAKQSS